MWSIVKFLQTLIFRNGGSNNGPSSVIPSVLLKKKKKSSLPPPAARRRPETEYFTQLRGGGSPWWSLPPSPPLGHCLSLSAPVLALQGAEGTRGRRRRVAQRDKRRAPLAGGFGCPVWKERRRVRGSSCHASSGYCNRKIYCFNGVVFDLGWNLETCEEFTSLARSSRRVSASLLSSNVTLEIHVAVPGTMLILGCALIQSWVIDTSPFLHFDDKYFWTEGVSLNAINLMVSRIVTAYLDTVQ
ncbi:uncharacterized protein [Triticum aestivum]|uniref:uncharacterized protein n=1 Tax=Triticum aestivum TaxID=4565 RepID=UPI001D023DDF|nr:uncharacterized protein LOC123057366 [Triticum aestivum]